LEPVILFDLDGTLIDSTDGILYSFHKSFEYFNFKKPLDSDIMKLIGYPLEHMYDRLGVESQYVDSFVSKYKEYYRSISKEMTTMLPYAIEAIQEASRVARLGVVTTKTARYSKELLEHMEVLKYFEVLIGREDVINPKPDPEPILKALDLMGVTWHKNVFMIGDTCLDMNSAKSAGIKGIAVSCEYIDTDTIKNCSEVLVNNSLEAVRYIKKTFS
jgi:phosphoglycolate phosphatase